MKRICLLLPILLLISGCVSAPVFQHDVTSQKKPWTHDRFIDKDEDFNFIILADRTGRERDNLFSQALKKANMFRPAFIMTVGDLIEGVAHTEGAEESLNVQWDELAKITSASASPFFHVVGNHDITRSRETIPEGNAITTKVWKERHGEHTYYYFIYKNVLFLCLNSQKGRDERPRAQQCSFTEEQVKWAQDVLVKHPEVRWTLVFVHTPYTWRRAEFAQIEKTLAGRKYTVFSGDWHFYCKVQRHGRNYYALATSGGGSKMRGIEYGEFDHITYVHMSDDGPAVTNILLDGILPDDVVTPRNIKQKLKANVELPVNKK